MEILYIPLVVKIWLGTGIGVAAFGCILAKRHKPPIENNPILDEPDENSYS